MKSSIPKYNVFMFQKLADIMTFLGKLYFLDAATLYRNFGSTMTRLMAYGDLQIQSWSSGLVFEDNGKIEARVSFDVIDSLHVTTLLCAYPIKIKTYIFAFCRGERMEFVLIIVIGKMDLLTHLTIVALDVSSSLRWTKPFMVF